MLSLFFQPPYVQRGQRVLVLRHASIRMTHFKLFILRNTSGQVFRFWLAQSELHDPIPADIFLFLTLDAAFPTISS